MAKNKIRIFCSPALFIGIGFAILSLVSLYVFTVAYKPCRDGILENIPIFIVWTIVAVGGSIGVIFAFSWRCFSLITIDDNGISRSFLGRFYKLHISWDAIREVCYKRNIKDWVFFSKTKEISGMTYDKAWMVKDAVLISLSKKRYAVISQYLQQPIVGMPDKVKERLTCK